MADGRRIAELRRRVVTDPASIAFALLAEEHRRDGDHEEAIRVCRTGLTQYPAYLSARVTLARALAELGQFDAANTELQYVLRVAPDNLAANKALAELHRRRDADTGTGAARDARAEAVHAEALQTAAVQAIARAEQALHVRPPLPTSSPESGVPNPEREPPAIPSFEPAAPPCQQNPALNRLEGWLETILRDRADRERTDAAS